MVYLAYLKFLLFFTFFMLSCFPACLLSCFSTFLLVYFAVLLLRFVSAFVFACLCFAVLVQNDMGHLKNVEAFHTRSIDSKRFNESISLVNDCRQSRLSRVATTTATAAATAATATLADLVWGFSGPAAVRLGPRWFGGFPGRRRSGRAVGTQ